MSPISDQELQRHLTRRTSRAIAPADREDVLAAVTAARARPRFPLRMRPRVLLAPIAAAVLVVLIGVPLMWTLSPGPRLSPSPSPGAVTIYTAQQLSDMIGDPAWVGHYVLAHAELGPMRQPPGVQCAAPDPCQDAYLVGVTGQNVVAIDWRDAPPGQGTQLQDGRQVQLLALPTSESVLAFKVSSASVEYLGPADLSPDGTPMTVPAATSSAPSAPVDDVYVVSGWLVATPGMPCPYVPGSPTDPNDGYLCNGAFLTADRTYTETAGGTGGSFPASGLHVQYGAYEQFAPDPASTALRGPEPRYGTYLVRAAGCPTFVSGDCPVFRMVGRLDEASANPSLVPSPTPSRAPLNVLTQDQLIALANDPTAIGRVVIANAQLAPVPMPSSSAACAPPDACDIGQIGVNPGVPVMAGWREATMPGEGIFDLTEGHWFVRLQPPAAFQKQVLALRIGRGSVEYLGTVQETGSSLVWSPSDVPAGSAAPSSIYAVNGWLVQTMIAECPAPPAGTGPSDPSYWCGGSFITAEQTSPRQLLDLGGLHVQWDAYPDYAPDASPNLGQGTEPRYGTYLVRPIGERYTTSGMSEIWRLVGRLDPPMSAASSSPSPSPSAASSATPGADLVHVYTTQQLSDMVGDPAWVGRYVLARTRMSRLLDYPATCPGAPKACPYAFLPDTAGPDLVVWTGPPWPPIPVGEGIFAFQVGETWVEYLGTVQQTGNSLVWSPGSPPGATAAPPYSIYAVSGWLVRTPPIPCPAPPDGDVSYWCGGSFITPTAIDFNYTPNVLDPGGLHVQADAYGNFAPNPTTTGGGGATSDRAIYLVRPVGQLPHEPNAWSLVGRLDPPMTGPTPSTTSTP